MKKVLLFCCIALLAFCLVSCKPDVEVKKYTVTFDSNGAKGDVPAVIEVKEGEKITIPTCGALSKDECVFDIWNTASNESGKCYLASDVVTVNEDIMLYAIWKPSCLNYTVEKDSCSVTCNDKTITSIVIPSFYNGKPITSIGREAFKGCSNLTEVIISSSVTSLEYFAFCKCSALTSIILPDNLTTIGIGAFHTCSNLETINMPASVTSIGNSAFIDCKKLTEITIPDGVKSIEKDVFNNCPKLTRITIPSSVTSIGNTAFFYCTSLKTIVYKGTKEQWHGIEKGSNWDSSTGTYKIHCTDGDIVR